MRASRRCDQPPCTACRRRFRSISSAPDHPQDLLHRLDQCRQAARCTGRPAHEAGDHGIGRPRPWPSCSMMPTSMRLPKILTAASDIVTPARSRISPSASWSRRASTISSSKSLTDGAGGHQGRQRHGQGQPDGRASAIRAASAPSKRWCMDAKAKGATITAGGHRIGNKGYFFEPTVVTDVPKDARAGANEEPFGPLALISPFSTFDEVATEANRLPFGLASYAFTSSTKTATIAIGCGDRKRHGLRSTASGSRCRKCRSAASRIPATDPRVALEAMEGYPPTPSSSPSTLGV